MRKVFIYGAILVCCMFTISYLSLDTRSKNRNGFSRNLVPKSYKIKYKHNLGSPYFYFISHSTKRLVLKNNLNPWSIYEVDLDLKNFESIPLSLPKDFLDNKNPVATIDANNHNIFINNIKKKIIAVQNKKSNITKLFRTDEQYVDHFSIISDNSICIRSLKINKSDKFMELVKLSFRNDSTIADAKFVLPRQFNDFLSTDGVLRYNQKNEYLTYMFYERGEYLILDTNLNLLFTGNTIDTNTVAMSRLKSTSKKEIFGKRSKTSNQSETPLLVNRTYFSDRNYIYIISDLIADNEKFSDFKNNEVIDVYLLKNGKYQKSFYVPKLQRNRITNFIVVNDMVYAICRNTLVVYSLI